MTTFISFQEILDESFPGKCSLTHRCITSDEAMDIIREGVESAIDAEDEVVVSVLREMFGSELKIQRRPAAVSLWSGDRLLVVTVTSPLPERPTREQLAASKFRFGLWTIGETDFRHTVS
jgi:hypothetical protein